jgi:hypothetical protein
MSPIDVGLGMLTVKVTRGRRPPTRRDTPRRGCQAASVLPAPPRATRPLLPLLFALGSAVGCRAAPPPSPPPSCPPVTAATSGIAPQFAPTVTAGAGPETATEAVPPPGPASPASPPASGPAAAPPPQPYQAALPAPEMSASAPARHFANLSPAQCRAELAKSALPVERDRRPTPGVATGTRVVGPLHGVRFVVPPRSSPYGVVDCRLTLAFGALADVLAAHGVTAVFVDNVYRARAHLPGSRRPSQHNYALAADVTSFQLADGRRLVIERDWPAALGAAPCGPEAELGSDTAEALELRNLVCDIASHQLFHHILTPNFDAAHSNHVHLDLQRDNPRSTIH